MGIVKDWKIDNEGYCFRYRVIHLISPKYWLKLHQYRKQRADRGWSDRDTWGAGDHIAKITAEMLQYLLDNSYGDWPEMFRTKFKEKDPNAYKDLQHVINDINAYLDYTKTEWNDGYDIIPKEIDNAFIHKDDKCIYNSSDWINTTTGKILTEKEVTDLIKKQGKKEVELYKKAANAMQFFGRNFTSFWD